MFSKDVIIFCTHSPLSCILIFYINCAPEMKCFSIPSCISCNIVHYFSVRQLFICDDSCPTQLFRFLYIFFVIDFEVFFLQFYSSRQDFFQCFEIDMTMWQLTLGRQLHQHKNHDLTLYQFPAMTTETHFIF